MKPVQRIIGCGILEKEIRYLIARNGWQFATAFLPSGLHVDFERLRLSLEQCLHHYAGETRVVFYGACHPCMEQILAAAGVSRTPGQNCVEICLGRDLFNRELENGAFFLFEDWARHWTSIIGDVMPGNPEIMRSIFRASHRYLLAIRTPCSDDFSNEAETVSAMTSLELRWLDVGLDELERNLAETVRRVQAGKDENDRPEHQH